MRKHISFLLSMFICFNFIFTVSCFAYDSNNIENKTSLKYLAVFIKFSNNNETHHIDDLECISNVETIFNSETFEMDTVKGKIKVPSFKKYFEMQSYGKLSIETEIFPKINGEVKTYVDSHPIEYYLKYSENNSVGYKTSEECLKRETELVNNAVKYISKQIESAGIKESEIDTENDGIVDAISFFIEGEQNLPSSISWGDLLWSHKSDNRGITETILGKRIVPYNIIYVSDYTQSAGAFSLNRGTYGTIIHEFGHTLGYMDLYIHNASQNRPVGFYDIMGNAIGSNPQNILTYFISEYNYNTNWHSPLQVINKTTNNITLYKPKFKDENEMRAIKVKQYADSEEYFVIEYYDKQNTYDTYTADKSGLIIYRVNDKNKYKGNAYSSLNGENDHIYVFRPDEIVLGEGKGDLTKATLNNERKILGKEIEKSNSEFDNQTIHYSNGSNSGIIVEVISQTEESVTFNVTFPKVQGEGTKNSPYLIYDVDTFLHLVKTGTTNKYFKLMSDLDFASITNYPKIDFEGNLDGNNKTIKNIHAEGTGVFNTVGNYNTHTIIENIDIENINVNQKGENHLGGFACVLQNVTLRNIHLKSGYVKNTIGETINMLASTGGFAGSCDNTTIIDNCSNSLDVSAVKNVGGFIGINLNATIKDCYVNGKVSGDTNVGSFIGMQCIMDTVYNVPQNVTFNYSQTKIENAVRWICKWIT